MTEPAQPKQQPEGQPPLVQAALHGMCPGCGSKTLFDNVTRFADRCSVCGLDFDQYNVGDGPAAFLTLIVGGLVTALALAVEIFIYPPFWVHILLWVPLTVILVLGTLRVSKAMLLIQEHRKQAAEGRVASVSDSGEGEN